MSIFNLDYYGMFVSDESSLYDLCWFDSEIEKVQEMISQNYKIDNYLYLR